MDSSFTIKSRPGAVPRSHALRDPVAVREAVDTELDPVKSVVAADDGGAKHGFNEHHDPHPHDVVIDPNAREALFNALDVRAEHSEQSPNQALMRQRAYQQHPEPKKIPGDDGRFLDPHADIEA